MVSKNGVESRLAETRSILSELGFPSEQQNERAALTLLALLDLLPTDQWAGIKNPLIGVTPIMDFAAKHYGRKWAPNTRETVRRFTLHQFVQAGFVIPNPDKPRRPTNSPHYCYQIAPDAFELLKKYGSRTWNASLKRYLLKVGSLAKKYAQERDLKRIPLTLSKDRKIALTPGGQNVLVKKIIEEFLPRFTPGATPVYVGDTGEKWAYFDEAYLKKIGTEIENHGKMPDVAIHYKSKNWLVLVEAVTSHGPMNPKRLVELKALFTGNRAGLVFVTAFLDRAALHKYLSDIAWETEVWIASDPDHMLHFNGERFLGPY